jgi:hypothetical protein
MLPRPLPTGFVAPCLPTAAPQPPSGEAWLHEIKHDGFRVIARQKGKQFRITGARHNTTRATGSRARASTTTITIDVGCVHGRVHGAAASTRSIPEDGDEVRTCAVQDFGRAKYGRVGPGNFTPSLSQNRT